MIRALGYSLIAAATLTACSGNDVKDTFAGIPVTSNPEGATVYVGRQKIGVTPMNIPDSAWERPGGRVGNTGILRVVAPGCQLTTTTISLGVKQGGSDIQLACKSEAFTPTDLSHLGELGWLQLFRTEELLFTPNVIKKLRKDEIHILYQEKRISDAEYRDLTTNAN